MDEESMKLKPPEQRKIEKQAEEMERKIVRFTNIDKESFTHSYKGISITVKTGKSYIGRLPECDHLAMHLARKMLSREKKAKLDPKVAATLYPEKEVNELKAKILSTLGIEDKETPTEEEARKKDIEQLAQKYEKSKPISPSTPVVNKKDVVKDLEQRGIKVDESKSKEELLEQLMEAEQKGIIPK